MHARCSRVDLRCRKLGKRSPRVLYRLLSLHVVKTFAYRLVLVTFGLMVGHWQDVFDVVVNIHLPPLSFGVCTEDQGRYDIARPNF